MLFLQSSQMQEVCYKNIVNSKLNIPFFQYSEHSIRFLAHLEEEILLSANVLTVAH